jgi:predicted aldo/keto reductase-like oxidoreductase
MLTTEENDTYDSVLKIIEASYKVPCTGCNYCMPCPHGVNIPGCFAGYNASYTIGLVAGLAQYVASAGILNEEKNYSASKCTECGTCEKKCPQRIPIPESLKSVTKKMEPFWLKAGLAIYFKLKG